MPASDDDWRLRHQERYLLDATLDWRQWTRPDPAHVHAWRMRDGTVRESVGAGDAPPAGAVESVPHRGWDHDHCDFCWATFTASATPDDDPEFLAAGYTIAEPERSTFWVCARCFEDFRERFSWTVVSDGAA